MGTSFSLSSTHGRVSSDGSSYACSGRAWIVLLPSRVPHALPCRVQRPIDYYGAWVPGCMDVWDRRVGVVSCSGLR